MELSELIPTKYKKNNRWSFNDQYLMFKKFEDIPLASIKKDGVIMLYMDHRLKKECVRVIEHLLKLDLNFYLIPPYFTNPKIEETYSDVIEHYLYTYSQQYFYETFPKINFDLIDNLVMFCEKTDTMDILKEMCENFKVEVNKTDYDYFSNKTSFLYSEEIRNEFSSLYRSIRIKSILS